jgi:hypothetical protein
LSKPCFGATQAPQFFLVKMVFLWNLRTWMNPCTSCTWGGYSHGRAPKISALVPFTPLWIRWFTMLIMLPCGMLSPILVWFCQVTLKRWNLLGKESKLLLDACPKIMPQTSSTQELIITNCPMTAKSTHSCSRSCPIPIGTN